MVEHEEEDEDVRENKLGTGATPPPPPYPPSLHAPGLRSCLLKDLTTETTLPGAAFKGVEASQVLTISEVNALLRRYIEGQRQDDPNYQVPQTTDRIPDA